MPPDLLDQNPLKIKELCLLVLALCWASGQAFGQKLIKGQVVESRSKTPIAYANIGIINTRVGTISNGDGTFSMVIPAGHIQDSLTFSALGFAAKTIPLQSFSGENPTTIGLAQKEILLEEVTVRAKKTKQWELGNRYTNGGLNMSSAEDANAGASVALLIENAHPSHHRDLVYPAFLGSARVRIYDNTTGPFKIRVRLYEVDSSSGAPGKDLLEESIVLGSEMKKGWLDFDLSPYKIRVDGAFFLAFEWILEETEQNALKQIYRDFEEEFPERVVIDSTLVDGVKLPRRHYIKFLPGTAFGVSLSDFSLSHYQCYSRYNSLGQWNRAAYILAARVRMGN